MRENYSETQQISIPERSNLKNESIANNLLGEKIPMACFNLLSNLGIDQPKQNLIINNSNYLSSNFEHFIYQLKDEKWNDLLFRNAESN
jgi:hypothetical protein